MMLKNEHISFVSTVASSFIDRANSFCVAIFFELFCGDLRLEYPASVRELIKLRTHNGVKPFEPDHDNACEGNRCWIVFF